MERHSQWNIDAANGGPITCILCCHHELAVVLCTVDVHTIYPVCHLCCYIASDCPNMEGAKSGQ